MSQRDHYRGRVVEQEFQRSRNDPQGGESGIDDAVVAEDHLPREHAQEVAGPEGDRDQDDPHDLVLLHAKGDEVRQGIGQRDGDQRHHGGDSNGTVENQVVDLLFEEDDVVLRGEGPDDVDVVLLPEAHGRQDEHGEKQPEHDHNQRRREQGISSRRLTPHEPRPQPPARGVVGRSPRGVHRGITVDGTTGGWSWARPRHRQGIRAFRSLRSGYEPGRAGPPAAGRRFGRAGSTTPCESAGGDISSGNRRRGTSTRWMPRNGCNTRHRLALEETPYNPALISSNISWSTGSLPIGSWKMPAFRISSGLVDRPRSTSRCSGTSSYECMFAWP